MKTDEQTRISLDIEVIIAQLGLGAAQWKDFESADESQGLKPGKYIEDQEL